MQRRKFLQNISLLAAASTLSSISISATEKKNKFTIAFISDIHVKQSEVAEAGMRKALRDINKMKRQPDFIINGGDSIMDALAADKDKTNGTCSIRSYSRKIICR